MGDEVFESVGALLRGLLREASALKILRRWALLDDQHVEPLAAQGQLLFGAGAIGEPIERIG